jgi:hypothetical protein
MELTKEEFCLFNIKSKIQFVEKDGRFITRRICSDLYLISLYKIYGFYVETIYEMSTFKTLSVDPVINIDIFSLYPPPLQSMTSTA